MSNRMSLDPLSADFLEDPYPHLAEQRSAAPVAYCEAIDMWLVTGHAEVEQVFMSPEIFSAANAQTPLLPLCEEAATILAAGFHIQPVMTNLDLPAHARIRRRLARAFSPRRMRSLEPVIEQRCAGIVAGWAGSDRVDLVRDLCYPLPALTIFTMIGFPDSDADQIKEWCADKLAVNWGRPSRDHQIRAAETMVAFWEYCADFIETRRNQAGDDLTTDLIRDETDGSEPLTDRELTSIVFGLSFAGHETTTNQAANCLRRVLEEGMWSELRRDRGLVAGAVEEAIRHDSSTIAWRRITTQETSLGGVRLPAGAKICVSMAAANRDPDQFEDPDRFDPRRANADRHISFGKGLHYCLGAKLARIEVSTILRVLLDEFTSIELEEPLDYTFPANISFRGPLSLPVRLAR